MVGDEWFDVLSVYWDDLVSCVAVDAWVVHCEVEGFECVADDEVLEYLGSICVWDEVHSGGLEACGCWWEDLCGRVGEVFRDAVVEDVLCVDHPWDDGLEMVGASEAFAFDGPCWVFGCLVGVWTACESGVFVVFPYAAVGDAVFLFVSELLECELDVFGFESVAAFHWWFSVWLFGHGFGEEFPEVDADFEAFVFCVGFEDSRVVVLCFFEVFVGFRLGFRGFGLFECFVPVFDEFVDVGLGVVVEGQVAAFGAGDAA